MLRMTLPCWAILEILPRNVDFIRNLIFTFNCWEYAQNAVVVLKSYFLGAISFFWGRNCDWSYVCIGHWLFVKVMGVVPSMHLCHSLALAVTLPLMMTNDKVDFRHNQPSHHRSISFIYMWHRRLFGWWTKLLMMSLTDMATETSPLMMTNDKVQ